MAASALSELEKFQPLVKAERSAAERIETLKAKTNSLPSAPTTPAEIALAAEIRRHIADQDQPAEFVWKNMKDPRVIAAISQGPAFLSDLNDQTVADVRNAVIKLQHPDQVREIGELEKASG